MKSTYGSLKTVRDLHVTSPFRRSFILALKWWRQRYGSSLYNRILVFLGNIEVRLMLTCCDAASEDDRLSFGSLPSQ